MLCRRSEYVTTVWLGVVMVAALALGGSPVAGPPSHRGPLSYLFSASAGGRPPALPYKDRYVVPEAPGSLAIGPDGNLFIADDSRDQVLELLPRGKFVVVVGDGDRGFSGDGSPALKADLDQPAGIAFGAEGALLRRRLGQQPGPEGRARRCDHHRRW